MLHRDEIKMSSQLDNKLYDESRLIEISIPLSMPYYQNTEFARLDGRINIKGIEYSYVKRKIENGYLILKCIPNNNAQLIKEKAGNYFAGANGFDKPSSPKSGQSKSTVKISIDDFEDMNCFAESFYLASEKKYYLHDVCFISLFQSFPQEQPPDIVV